MKNQPKSTKFKRNLTNKLCCFLLVCWFACNLPCVYGFLSLKYSFAASLHLSRHFLFLLLRVGLCLLILSPAQNLLVIDNLANLTEDWLKLTDSACVYLQICLATNTFGYLPWVGLALVCATNLPCTAKFNQNILVYFALNLRDFVT